MVGVTRFELVASSVSGKRSPPELNARSADLSISGGNNTKRKLDGNYFLSSMRIWLKWGLFEHIPFTIGA